MQPGSSHLTKSQFAPHGSIPFRGGSRRQSAESRGHSTSKRNLGELPVLASAPELTEAGVAAQLGQGGRPAGQTNASHEQQSRVGVSPASFRAGALDPGRQDACPALPPALHRKGYGGGTGALRGGSRKCSVMRYLSGDSKDGGPPSAVLGCTGQVRRRSGACPARLPCGSYKTLGLRHLRRESCILRSPLFLLRFPPERLQ